jgi:Tfp pilus assembly protein PilF
MRPSSARSRTVLVAAGLVAASLAAYWNVWESSFVFDDYGYVAKNPRVQGGLSWSSFAWAFTTTWPCIYHPLTWLSHMLDAELWGAWAGGHHLTSLLLHAANTILLFLALKMLTGAFWRSAFVAGLFALLPLNVESVAWVAERKNVLSTLLLILTVWAYGRYAKKPDSLRYGVVLVLFLLGLLAKATLVTLPFLFLLLDFWPLGRLSPLSEAKRKLPRLLLEKVPFFLIAAAVSIFTVKLLVSSGITTSQQYLYPIGIRLETVLVSYILYIWKAVWPFGLTIYYPHPAGAIPLWQAAAAAAAILLVTIAAIRLAARFPYLLIGWLWYIIVLLPNSGLFQVIPQQMADHYAYVAHIGLFVCLAWGLASVAGRRPRARHVLVTFACLLLVFFGVITNIQARTWKDSIALFTHALRCTENNYIAHTSLGVSLMDQGRLDEAISHFEKSLAMKPNYLHAHMSLGVALAKKGRFEEAIRHYREALEILPTVASVHFNLGVALEKNGEREEAASHFREALRLDPEYADAHYGLGVILAQEGALDDAAGHLSRALRSMPQSAAAHMNLGLVLLRQGRSAEAAAQFRETLRIDPGFAGAGVKLEEALSGKREER